MLVVASGCLGLGGCKSRGWDCSPGGVQPPAWEGGLRVPVVARGCLWLLGAGGCKSRGWDCSPGGGCNHQRGRGPTGCLWLPVVAWGWGVQKPRFGLLPQAGAAHARFGWLPWVRGDCAIRVVALGATYLLYLGAGRLRDSGGRSGCGAIARFGWSPWVLLTLLYLGAGRLRDSGGCPGCGAIARFGWLPLGCGAIARFGWSLWVRGDCAIRVVAWYAGKRKTHRQPWTTPKSGFGAQRPLPSPAGPLLARSECGHGPHAHLWQPVRPSDTPAFAGGALPAKPLGERRRGVSSVERAPPNPSVTTWAMVVPSDPGRQASASAAPPGASYAGVASGRQRSFPPPQ